MADVRVGRCMSTVNDTNHWPRSNRTAADITRAVPASTLSTSPEASSWSLTRPSRGRTACLVSHRIAPVVNRTDNLPRCLDLNRGNPTGAPLRFPDRESPQFFWRPCQPVKAGIERLFGALAPPRRNLTLGRVPLFAQRVQRPRHSRGQGFYGYAVGGFGFPLPHDRLDVGQAPVVRDPGRAAVRRQVGHLRRGRVEREPVRQQGHGTSCPIAATPRAARFAAARRPYSRAHSDVRICAWSRTRSSSTCVGST